LLLLPSSELSFFTSLFFGSSSFFLFVLDSQSLKTCFFFSSETLSFFHLKFQSCELSSSFFFDSLPLFFSFSVLLL